jgi:hypothetical protein
MIRALILHSLISAAFIAGCLLIAVREPFGVVVAGAAAFALVRGR